MKSQDLAHILIQLLNEQPLVVVPGLGGFVKEQVPAFVDTLRNRIHPPRNTVIFNPRLVHNDGMVLSAISTAHGLSYTDADHWLSEAIAELRFSLHNGNEAEIRGLGKLQKTTDGSIRFVADETPDLQHQFFGLKAVSAIPVEKDNVDKMRELVASNGPVATKVRTLPLARMARYAAAAAAIGFFLWLPVQKGLMNNGKTWVNALNLLPVHSETTYQPRMFSEDWLPKGFEQPSMLSDHLDHPVVHLKLTKGAARTLVVKTDAAPTEKAAPTKEESAPGRFKHFKVIAASFPSQTAAMQYVAKMQERGFSATYAGTENGKHLVAYGIYDSRKDAEKMLASVSLSNKQARIVPGN